MEEGFFSNSALIKQGGVENYCGTSVMSQADYLFYPRFSLCYRFLLAFIHETS